MQTLQLMPKKQEGFVNCVSRDISELLTLLLEDLHGAAGFAFWVIRS